jgi:hypothetical protein
VRYSRAVISRVGMPSSSSVPIADGHLDRGCDFLTATLSLGVTLPFGSQTLKLKLDCCIGIVDHNPSPTIQAAKFCSKHGGGWAFPWRNRGSALQTKRPAERLVFRSRLPLSPISRRKVAATKKNPKHFTHLGFRSLLPQSGFFSWAAGVGGWGAAQLGLVSGI